MHKEIIFSYIQHILGSEKFFKQIAFEQTQLIKFLLAFKVGNPLTIYVKKNFLY